MDQKHHWAYPALTRPGLSRAQLLVHFRHEYAVYVRDFPVLLARCLGQVPALDDVRRALAENLYEEQTGGLSKQRAASGALPAHDGGPRLRRERQFADDDARFTRRRARTGVALRATAAKGPWQAAVALLTIFVEGSVNERAELAGTYVRRARASGGARARAGQSTTAARPRRWSSTRAHAEVEGGHRERRVAHGARRTRRIRLAEARREHERASRRCRSWHATATASPSAWASSATPPPPHRRRP